MEEQTVHINGFNLTVSYPDDVSVSVKFAGDEQYEEARALVTYDSKEKRDEDGNTLLEWFTKAIILGGNFAQDDQPGAFRSYSYHEGSFLNHSVIGHTRNEKDNRSYIKIGHLEIARYGRFLVKPEWNKTDNPPLFAYGSKGTDSSPRTVVYSFKKKAGKA